jgi:predicted nuclease of restriction endonuclease-like (RecB) superfamily
MKFEILVNKIQETHRTLQENAVSSINRHLTIRNWLIGHYIIEFEQKGEDRAKYGEKLMPELVKVTSIKGLSETNLKVCRQFYLLYPQISQVIVDQLTSMGLEFSLIRQTLSDEFQNVDNHGIESVRNPVFNSGFSQEYSIIVPPDKIITRLSYSHLVQLFPIDDPIKRAFYEMECIKGNWSVRELKRQINTLYYERSGMSRRPDQLSRLVQEKGEETNVTDIIKSPFTFEFLGLQAKDVVYESNLEEALVNHLEGFLLEMGHGFCFEAKQKRILIGDEYYFIDLVFYHRVLKCHILVELKIDEVKHEHIGQLKTYINYYKKEIMLETDNPPIGILLVTKKKKALVEYAVAETDLRLFVSKYVVELPSKEQLEEFIRKELSNF